MPALALTDTNGLYASVQFYKLAQEAGMEAERIQTQLHTRPFGSLTQDGRKKSRFPNTYSPATFPSSRKFSATGCTSRCSASHPEMDAYYAKQNASAANSACRWWRQTMFISCDPKSICIIAR